MAMYREAADGSIENDFSLQLTNASEQARRYTVRVDGLPGLRLAEPPVLSVPAAAIGSAVIVLQAPADAARAGAHPIRITVADADDPKIATTETAKFWLP